LHEGPGSASVVFIRTCSATPAAHELGPGRRTPPSRPRASAERLSPSRLGDGREAPELTEKGEDGEPVMVMMPRVTIVDADKISDEAAAAVAEVWQTVNGALRVKMHDKHAALVSLGKHLGLFTDNVQIERKQISAEPMSAEEWKRQYVREG
jgi:hypothetical protein